MLVYTFGIPISIFAFLLVGALVGTAAPDPGAGIMPGLIAGCAVFAWCMSIQKKANNDLENPEPIPVNCSPEKAFSTIYDCLVECHANENYWSLQPLQNSLKIVGSMKFSEVVCGGEKPSSANRLLRIVAKVSTNAAGKTVVNLAYTVHSPQGRWKCDEGIELTTRAIKRDLMAA
jgi:hypothetical protein